MSETTAKKKQQQPVIQQAEAPAEPALNMEQKAEALVREKRALHSTGLKSSEFTYTHWSAVVKKGTEVEDLCIPEFWVHVARQLKPRDIIRVFTEDNSFTAEVMVLSAGRLSAYVKIISHTDLSGDVTALNQAAGAKAQPHFRNYEIAFSGPGGRWTVVRLRDKVVMHNGANTKQEAQAWLIEHINKNLDIEGLL